MYREQRNVQQHRVGLVEIPIFSYVNTFFDGEEVIHPAIKCGVLFSLSRTYIKGQHIVLDGEQIISEHLKTSKRSYLIRAPNQGSKAFNGAVSGVLRLTEKQLKSLVKMGADITFFSSSLTTSIMFKHINGKNILTATYADATKLLPEGTDARAYFGLPESVIVKEEGQPDREDESLEVCYNKIQQWAIAYAEAPDPKFDAVLEFIKGNETAKGFIPGSEKLRENAVLSAANAIVAKFTAGAFGADVTEADAIETAAAFVRQDTTNDLINAATTMDADAVTAIAESLGIELPVAVVAEDVKTALENAAGTEQTPAVPAVPNEDDAVPATEPAPEPAVTAATPVAEEVDAEEENSKLPAQVVPAGHIVVSTAGLDSMLSGQLTTARALQALGQGLEQNIVGMRQMFQLESQPTALESFAAEVTEGK